MPPASIPMVPAGSARFEGRYTRDFEVSSFTPRGGHQGHDEHWWVDPKAMVGLPALEPDERGRVAADVVLVGWLSVPGSYGHLGGYHRHLRVHRIIAAARPDGNTTPAPPPPTLGRPSPWIADDVLTVEVGRLSQLLNGSAGPGLSEIVAPKPDLRRVLDTFAARHPLARVARVHGIAIDNSLNLFQAIQDGLGDDGSRLPLTWDAMRDRLAALRADGRGPLAIVVFDAEEMMLDATDQFEESVRQLAATATDGDRGVPLHVVLHTTEEYGSILRTRLERVDPDIARLDAAWALTDKADGVIYDSTASLELQRVVSGGESAAAEAAIRALWTFCPDVLVPLDFGVTVACVDEGGEGAHDPSRRPAEWHRYLRTNDMPDEIDAGPVYRDANVVEVPSVDTDTMRDGVARLLDQGCDHCPGTELAWTEMYVSAGWLPVPAPARLGSRSSVVLDDLDGHRLGLEVPLTERDGGLWVGGPLRWVGLAPVEVQVNNDGGVLVLRIWVRWSLWWKEGEPGRDALDGVVQHLAADGWQAR